MSSQGSSQFKLSLRGVGKELIDRYKHARLPSDDVTRILTLWPREECVDGAIHATLLEAKFAGLPDIPFTALSYNWGDVENQQIIHLHNKNQKYGGISDMARHLQQGKFRVRSNLFAALKTLQSAKDWKLLWIDALCINQDDAEEKEQQLARMSVVYAKAKTVLIWLGPGNEQTDRAMEFVPKVVKLTDVKALVTDKKEINNWRCLAGLMQLTWFKRRWVIQELALAKNAIVYCGESRVSWDDLRDAISLMGQYLEQISALLKDSKEHDNNYYALGDIHTLEAKVLVDTVHNVFRRNGPGAAFEPIQGLEYLVSTLSNFHCADPRDTINALRNIAKESTGSKALTGENEPPKPDYSVNKTLTHIYVDFVQWVYNTSGRIDIICCKWALPEREERPRHTYSDSYPKLSKLPSWVQVVPAQKQAVHADRGGITTVRRVEGDSFVGVPGVRAYNASSSVPADVIFPQLPRKDGSSSAQRSQDNSQGAGLTDEPARLPILATSAHDRSGRRSDRKRSASEYEQDEISTEHARRNAVFRNVLPGLDIDADFIEGASEVDYLPCNTSPTSSTSSDEVMALMESDASIRVLGIQIGKIKMTTDRMTETVHDKVVNSLQGDMREDMRGNRRREYPDRLWRGLIAERAASGGNPPATYQRACELIVENHTPSGQIDTRELLTSNCLSDIEKEYLKRVQAVICNRVFFEATRVPNNQKKKESLRGFGPANCKRDDIICILFGCCVPVVLRRANDPDRFRLIGECYVYGLMDGDAVSSLGEALDSQKQQFRID